MNKIINFYDRYPHKAYQLGYQHRLRGYFISSWAEISKAAEAQYTSGRVHAALELGLRG